MDFDVKNRRKIAGFDNMLERISINDNCPEIRAGKVNIDPCKLTDKID